jgi:hypothetical protein
MPGGELLWGAGEEALQLKRGTVTSTAIAHASGVRLAALGWGQRMGMPSVAPPEGGQKRPMTGGEPDGTRARTQAGNVTASVGAAAPAQTGTR